MIAAIGANAHVTTVAAGSTAKARFAAKAHAG